MIDYFCEGKKPCNKVLKKELDSMLSGHLPQPVGFRERGTYICFKMVFPDLKVHYVAFL